MAADPGHCWIWAPLELAHDQDVELAQTGLVSAGWPDGVGVATPPPRAPRTALVLGFVTACHGWARDSRLGVRLAWAKREVLLAVGVCPRCAGTPWGLPYRDVSRV